VMTITLARQPGAAAATRLSVSCREFAVVAAVEQVNAQAQREPHDEADPGDHREPGHQASAKYDRDQREPRHEWNSEGTRAVRLLAAKKDHSQRDQRERKQCADVREIS